MLLDGMMVTERGGTMNAGRRYLITDLRTGKAEVLRLLELLDAADWTEEETLAICQLEAGSKLAFPPQAATVIRIAGVGMTTQADVDAVVLNILLQESKGHIPAAEVQAMLDKKLPKALHPVAWHRLVEGQGIEPTG